MNTRLIEGRERRLEDSGGWVVVSETVLVNAGYGSAAARPVFHEANALVEIKDAAELAPAVGRLLERVADFLS